MEPRVTIITATYNAVSNLRRCIESVQLQSYGRIEHVVVDGGSCDGTVELLKSYGGRITWISEPDDGIADAFNKGIQLSRGDYINFQGADDYLWDHEVVATVMEGVEPARDLLVCGRIKRVDQQGRVLWESSPRFKKRYLLFRMALPHQALFTNRMFFQEYGYFDTDLRYAMDYEHLLRAKWTFPAVIMRDVFVAAWQAGGVGTDRTIEVLEEYDRIKRKNNVASPLMLALVNSWARLKFHIKSTVIPRHG